MMVQLGQEAPKRTGSKPPRAACVKIDSVRAFPDQAKFSAGWALSEIIEMCSEAPIGARPFGNRGRIRLRNSYTLVKCRVPGPRSATIG